MPKKVQEDAKKVSKKAKATKEKKGGIISRENYIHISNLRNLDKDIKKEEKGKK